MSMYEVWIQRTEWGAVIVEADNEDSASERAIDGEISWGKDEFEIQRVIKIEEDSK